MAVEYHASRVTNMDMDSSKIGYKQLMDGRKLQYSVSVLRNSPFRIATLCLGLLCVFLLAGVIGQSVHYRKVEREHQSSINAMSKEKDTLQVDLKTVQKQKRDLETRRDQLQNSVDHMSMMSNRLNTNNRLLTDELNKLKQSQTQLQASSTALNTEVEQLRASNDRLQTNNNALSTAKDLLQKQYDSVHKRKNELQVSYDSATRDRDNLQNKYNNVTRSKEQLQIDYNTLIKDLEHLQDRYNFSTNEKEALENSHQNLTISKETLQATYNELMKVTDELRASYSALLQEKDDLDNSCKTITVERDLLNLNKDNLTAERDQLQAEIVRLNALILDKKCPTGWRKFQSSCYYTSTGKKTWALSRENCQSKGADLAIIKSQEEMAFINGLYSSDKEVWIGLTDSGAENQWRWVDGTPLTTTFWGRDQPNSFEGRQQDCVEFWHHSTQDGSWNDENCNVEQNWICEM